MEEKFEIGDIVLSTSGHDKNQVFMLVSIDKNGYFDIIDGRTRLRNKPKKKNPKHLVKIGHDDKILEKINSPIATDAEIYKMIKVYNK